MKLFCRDEMQRLEMAAVAAGVPLSQLMDNAGAAVAKRWSAAAARWGASGRWCCAERATTAGTALSAPSCWPSGAWPAGWCWPRASPPPTWPLRPLRRCPPRWLSCPGRSWSKSARCWRPRTCSSTACLGSASGGSSPACPKAAGLWQRPALPESLRRPAQRRGVRHGPGVRRGLPGGRHRDLHREEARQRQLPRQGVLRGDGGAPGGASPPPWWRGRRPGSLRPTAVSPGSGCPSRTPRPTRATWASCCWCAAAGAWPGPALWRPRRPCAAAWDC